MAKEEGFLSSSKKGKTQSHSFFSGFPPILTFLFLDGFSAFKKNCAFGTSGMEAKG
jgi:hypothetical protein